MAAVTGLAGCSDGEQVDGEMVITEMQATQKQVKELTEQVDALQDHIDEKIESEVEAQIDAQLQELASSVTTAAPSYTDLVEANFIDACVGAAPTDRVDPSPEELCECTFDGIRERIPAAEFMAMEESVNAGIPSALTDDVQAISLACEEELSGG